MFPCGNYPRSYRLGEPRLPVVGGGALPPPPPVLRSPSLPVPFPALAARTPRRRPGDLPRLPLPATRPHPSPSDAEAIVSCSTGVVPSRAKVTPALRSCNCAPPSSPADLLPSMLSLVVYPWSREPSSTGLLLTSRGPASAGQAQRPGIEEVPCAQRLLKVDTLSRQALTPNRVPVYNYLLHVGADT